MTDGNGNALPRAEKGLSPGSPGEGPGPSARDATNPEGKWAFDEEVTGCFDDMLRRSIPQYEVMRELVFTVGRRYVQRGTDILDLGCSRGEALAPFTEAFGAYNRYVGVEISPPMLGAARERFQGLINVGLVDIRDTDLTEEIPPVKASLILSVLTIQFTPIECRHRIIEGIYEHLVPGGAFILVEKVLGARGTLDDLFTSLYYEMKEANGYSPEQITRKRLALRGVLVPVTAKWNEELLLGAGFRQVDCFWRWMNFAAWVAVKPGEGA